MPRSLPAPPRFLQHLRLQQHQLVTGRWSDPTPTGERLNNADYHEYEIITVLGRDAIPAIDNPQFFTAAEATEFYGEDEPVLGVVFNGEARAYSIPLLSRHEIVNDNVGGVKIAVTW